MKLGQHFDLGEFLRSEAAARSGRSIETPPDEVVGELLRLVQSVLDPLRASIGRPIAILSGYRPPWLNQKVGGAKNSDHLYGRAADLIVAGMKNHEVCQRAKELALPVKQAILEFPPAGWVHLSIDPVGQPPKREYLTAVKSGSKTVYLPGTLA